jgi:ribosomal protein S18 acetylase RimI-like enzyme
MTSDLARAFEFFALADMAGTTVEPSPLGSVVRCPERPLRQDSNYLLVDHTDAAAVELSHEVERHMLRAVFVRDEATGSRLVHEFTALGWHVHKGLVMAHRRSPVRATPDTSVSEVDHAALRPLRRQAIVSAPWGSPELAGQILEAKAWIGERITARFFAVLLEGEAVAAADLYLHEDNAQIEDIRTVEKYRNRGYASALVLRALEEARNAGATFICLVADADDWPRLLYERLGFDVIGRYTKFFP